MPTKVQYQHSANRSYLLLVPPRYSCHDPKEAKFSRIDLKEYMNASIYTPRKERVEHLM